jgi:hydroxypyruvate reductase
LVRRLALDLYLQALEAVRGDLAVARALSSDPPGTPVAVVAIGKAACAMAAGARKALGGNIDGGLVITRHGYATGFDTGDLTVLTAGHPIPDAASLRAGHRLLDFLARLPDGQEVLFLLSGGTSSLVEVLPPGVALADLVRANQWLLASGLDIHAINRIRASLSAIKSGRLAMRLAGRPARVLLMSDVPDDVPASIGSGLLVPPNREPVLPDGLPAWLADLAEAAPPAPQAGDPATNAIAVRIIATNHDALEGAAARSRSLGLSVRVHDIPLTGTTGQAARRIIRTLEEHRRRETAGGVVQLWGGETHPALPAAPGKGGRSQHLALVLAQAIAGWQHACVLCAGTDGSDGPGEDAGALVDGGTIDRGQSAGMSPAQCLEAADSGAFLEASADLVSTGPTGTNVMDVVIAVDMAGTDFPSSPRASRLVRGPGEPS